MPNPVRPFAALALVVALAGCAGVQGPVAQPALVPYVPPVAAAPLYEPVAPAQALVAYGSSCYAGFYRCQLQVSSVIGSQCACPGLGAPSYGVVE